MFTVVDETINHVGGVHIVGCAHENGAEPNMVKKLGIKIENGFVAGLNRPVHGEHDWLVDKSGVRIGQQGEQCDESIVSGDDALCEVRLLWKHIGLMEDTCNVVLPVKIHGALVLREVNVEFKVVVGTMSLTKEFVGDDVIATRQRVVGKCTIPRA
jgi:hypothetical protein